MRQMAKLVRRVMSSAVMIACASFGVSIAIAADREGPASHVIELFTSQGCSSCPPADAYIGQLAQYPNTIVLSWHVDYWDYIGWQDSFAHPHFTKRQKQYARVNGLESIYTPQFVHNGVEIIAGFRPSEVINSLNLPVPEAPPITKTDESLIISPLGSGGPFGVSRIWYAPETNVHILQGENTGKQLNYFNTVRAVEHLSQWSGADQIRVELATARSGLESVVLVQDRVTMRIVAAWHD